MSAGLEILPRHAWLPTRERPPRDPGIGRVEFAVVHHTALGAGGRPEQVPALLREIHALHVRERGWDDIGYNLLVDRFGRVWEGRAGGVERAVVGAHARGVNHRSTGIAVVGDWSASAPPTEALSALAGLLRWKLRVHGLLVMEETVRAHREVASTQCPGGGLAAALTRLRRDAVAFQPAPI